MHQAILFRELRGSIHLAALAALGCPTRVAHQIRRPDDLKMFGYEDVVEVTDAHRAAYEQAEPLTDQAMVAHAEAWLSADERALIARVSAGAMAALEVAG